MDGIVVSYDDMTPIPVISYNKTNRQQAQRRQKAKPQSSTHQLLLITLCGQDAMETFLLLFIDITVCSVGTIQATELMIANNGAPRFYTGEAGTHIIGDITIVGNLTNSNLQGQLNLKAPLRNPTFSGTVGGLSKGMVNLAV